ncbi:chemokine (C-X-C motif) ligand 12b (stromal cell-derived factor 1) isoform X3 [Stigmatopora nigra]
MKTCLNELTPDSLVSLDGFQLVMEDRDAEESGRKKAKPISLVERCWCRSTLNTVPQRSIKELKFLHTPNCPFQVMVKKSRRRNNKKI